LFLFDGDSTTGATAGARAGAAAVVGVTAFFFWAGSTTGTRTGAGATTGAGAAAAVEIFLLQKGSLHCCVSLMDKKKQQAFR
jgi:hypothetical protein